MKTFLRNMMAVLFLGTLSLEGTMMPPALVAALATFVAGSAPALV